MTKARRRFPRQAAWLTVLMPACIAAGPALAQTPPACPFSPDTLKAAFGIGFEAGKPQPSMGTGCAYKTLGGSAKSQTDFSVSIFINPSFPEPQRRMFLAAGAKHELEPVPGDADKALIVRHRGDVPPFAQVAYVRGGHDVMLHLTGAGGVDDPKARRAMIDSFNQKLLKLPRVP